MVLNILGSGDMNTDDCGEVDEKVLHVTACGRRIKLHTIWCGRILIRIRLSLHESTIEPVYGNVCQHDLFQAVIDGRVGSYALRYEAHGTEFQKRIWNAACRVPYGATVSYGRLTHMAGCGSPQAAGQALKANPLPVIIPCHRVVGARGELTGFSSGIEIKKILLEHEYENSSSK